MTVEGGGAQLDPAALPAVTVEQARAELAQGGVPSGATLVRPDGAVLGRERDGRVQDGDASMHAETAAFRAAARQRGYRRTTMTMVTTLSPCWYRSRLVRQFGIGPVAIGEARTFHGGHDWPAQNGVQITIVDDPEYVELMRGYIAARPALWYEGIGRAE